MLANVSRISLLATLVAATLGACGPSVPDQLVYRVRLPDAERYAGATVSLDGVAVGVVAPYGTVNVTTPSSVRPAAMHLTIALPTQCGMATVPIALMTLDPYDDSQVAREMSLEGFMMLTAYFPPNAVRAVPLLVDRTAGDTRELRVGEAVIPPDIANPQLFVGTCGTTAPVRVGDETIGTWDASSAATLISVEATCHQLANVAYGVLAVAERPQLLPARVQALAAAPDYFLARAPSQVDVGSPLGTGHRTELTRVPCP